MAQPLRKQGASGVHLFRSNDVEALEDGLITRNQHRVVISRRSTGVTGMGNTGLYLGVNLD